MNNLQSEEKIKHLTEGLHAVIRSAVSSLQSNGERVTGVLQQSQDGTPKDALLVKRNVSRKAGDDSRTHTIIITDNEASILLHSLALSERENWGKEMPYRNSDFRRILEKVRMILL